MTATDYALRPIGDAPIKSGQPYGPCLLTPGIDGSDWVIGEWDGDGWFNLDGDRALQPRLYWLLPPAPSLL